MKSKLYIIFLSCFLWFGCNTSQKGGNEIGITPIAECKKIPKYISQAGFIPGKPFGFSVAEKGAIGLSLVQFPAENVPYKRFSLPSWNIAGHLGAVVTDQNGNNYVIPRPFINTLKNDPAKQNIVYKVNSENGNMEPFMQLPTTDSILFGNPFGLLGLAYDCELGILYASSVSGSDVNHEVGTISAIQTIGDAKVIATLEETDVMGLGISYFEGKKYLFIGKARNSDIYRVELDKNGGFIGQPIFVHSLQMLGDRGDDKPRKIKFDAAGNMVVSGVEFNFNLSNTADAHENIYTFQWVPDQKKWILINQRKGIQ